MIFLKYIFGIRRSLWLYFLLILGHFTKQDPQYSASTTLIKRKKSICHFFPHPFCYKWSLKAFYFEAFLNQTNKDKCCCLRSISACTLFLECSNKCKLKSASCPGLLCMPCNIKLVLILLCFPQFPLFLMQHHKNENRWYNHFTPEFLLLLKYWSEKRFQ